MKVAYQMDVACAPETLWSFIIEPAKQALWMKGLVENVPTSEGPQGVGSTSRMAIKEGGKVSYYDTRLTAYDPPRRVELDLSGKNFGESVVQVEYNLTGLNGGTHLDYLVTMTTTGKTSFLHKLMWPIGVLFSKMMLRGFMKKLKDLAEREERVPVA